MCMYNVKKSAHFKGLLMSFAEKVKQTRVEKGLTQDEMADAIGVSKRTYIEYETGRNEPKLSTITLIANKLCLSVSELLSEPMKFKDHAEWFVLNCIRQMESDDKEALLKVCEALLMQSRRTQLARDAQKAYEKVTDEDGNEWSIPK